MGISREALVYRITGELLKEQYDLAVRDLLSIAADGYPPPTESINRALANNGSKVRLWEGVASKVEVNGPHGGGCDITYPMTIRKINSPTNERQFDYVIKIRWDRDGGWFGKVRHQAACTVVGLIANKVVPHTTHRIATSIGIIGKSRS